MATPPASETTASAQWTEVRLRAVAELPLDTDSLAQLLIEAMDCGGLQEYTWGDGEPGAVEFLGYVDTLDTAAAAQQAREAVASLGLAEVLTASVRLIAKQNWQENWREFFKPVQVTEQLLVAPSWEHPNPGSAPGGKRALYIEPGMAFGTGTHETTQLCLELLEGMGVNGRRVLDIGCGSAILALRALQLGAREAIAIDNDADILENAHLNRDLNGLGDAALEIAVELYDPAARAPFDVILCNMLSREFLPLLPVLRAGLAAGGQLLLSGYLNRDEQETIEACAGVGLSPVGGQHRRGEWSAAVYTAQ